MSSILIQDLAHSSRLDRLSMADIRGAIAQTPDVRVNVAVNQQIAQFQEIGVNVLNNNGVIGAGFQGPKIALSPSQWARNEAVLPQF
jgi:hypothetical protein